MLAILCLGSMRVDGQVSIGKYLYTKPDPSAEGGIRGQITGRQEPLVAVFALPADEPRFVYKGTVTGSEKKEFKFNGLPIGKYDLLLVFDDSFYEGLTLSRCEDSLLAKDRALIEKIISRSEPYFNKKVINRMLGKTGTMTGKARCICTFFRSKPSTGFSDGKTYTGRRQSLKLVLLEDVGPGWQVTKTREIYSNMVKPDSGIIKHVYRKHLGNIRVIDKVKDMGRIDLSKFSP